MGKRVIKIFDTTLRDGEQTPGVSLNVNEKLEIAKQLEKLKVDVIEAGFAIASPGDFEAIKVISENIKDAVIVSLARAVEKDIDRAYEALKNAQAPRIHTFIATSDIHMKYKLKMTEDEVLERAVAMVKYAKKYVSDVEFSCEDATRSRIEFLIKVFDAVIKAGATVINIPDTVGYTTPEEMKRIIRAIKENIPDIDKVQISVHCHNDLGLAVANSLAAVEEGVHQVECTINGLGERAGNAALEEIVMALKTRKDFYDVDVLIDTTQIYRTSKLVSSLTGVFVQPNKAIVGANAFAHESGIHQHGVLSERTTYEIIDPVSIGLPKNRMVLGKHSGRHAFEERLKELGYTDLTREEIDAAFEKFKVLADKKKVVLDKDIEALLEQKSLNIPETYELVRFQIISGNGLISTASVKIKSGDEELEEAATGDGPVDAIFKAIDRITGLQVELDDYSIKAVTQGKDALGEVTVRIKKDGKAFLGRGLSTDILEASAKAYVNAINKMLYKISEE
ncbi:2-isopropylmalate synthase [Caldicellulosiruptor hydrothermalis 108]|uniref:2-isopropylmalate synthase n=1 Tax=Caldicellulosiruptor hydrothermalis (strain DSM 18901 / VKM B-2411 / 108) TaxID=632292 RepID=E4Q7V5_CALH1|nr:2-isopropylmalate synthase [Caldicellulosiruptor hydrothermalis]ADQ07873.1 2-isopropylmalate synthase [Caldicellulosiruptor hydrothermalis 108]